MQDFWIWVKSIHHYQTSNKQHIAWLCRYLLTFFVICSQCGVGRVTVTLQSHTWLKKSFCLPPTCGCLLPSCLGRSSSSHSSSCLCLSALTCWCWRSCCCCTCQRVVGPRSHSRPEEWSTKPLGSSFESTKNWVPLDVRLLLRHRCCCCLLQIYNLLKVASAQAAAVFWSIMSE